MLVNPNHPAFLNLELFNTIKRNDSSIIEHIVIIIINAIPVYRSLTWLNTEIFTDIKVNKVVNIANTEYNSVFRLSKDA